MESFKIVVSLIGIYVLFYHSCSCNAEHVAVVNIAAGRYKLLSDCKLHKGRPSEESETTKKTILLEKGIYLMMNNCTVVVQEPDDTISSKTGLYREFLGTFYHGKPCTFTKEDDPSQSHIFEGYSYCLESCPLVCLD